MWLSLWGGGGVHWWQVVGSSVVVLSFGRVFPPFVPLLLLLWCVACEYASISHFKAVLVGFLLFCVGLCCLGALRGLWGLCTRVKLGGLKARGVFASVFRFFAFRLFLCLLCFGALLLLLLGLFSCLAFPFLLCLCVFFFPCGLYAKERAQSVFASSLVLLWFVVMRLPIVRGLPAIPFPLLRDLIRNCSIVGGSRQNIGNLMR